MANGPLVIDLGNTRLKWGRIDRDGRVIVSLATANDDPGSWGEALVKLGSGPFPSVAISSVHPPMANRLGEFLERSGIGPIHWFRSAADVPVPHFLDAPERTGADRALSVLAAIEQADRPGPGIVVQCGTAITVERIDQDGIWQGGAIAIGPGLAASALHSGTAQLPGALGEWPNMPPPAWGTSTVQALEAGILWGAVGTIRELIARQSEGLEPAPWIRWTGGDAAALASLLSSETPLVEPDLVLQGLGRLSRARTEFPADSRGGRAIDSWSPSD